MPPDALIPLNQTETGRRVRLVAINGGDQLRRRLLSLGLATGGVVEVMHRRGGGVVLAREGNRVALGHGVAQKVLVEAIE